MRWTLSSSRRASRLLPDPWKTRDEDFKSVVISEALRKVGRKGCFLSEISSTRNLLVENLKLALTKETLLTEEDVEMWLQHVSVVSTR